MNENTTRLASGVLLFSLVCAIYGPGLTKAPEFDQWQYFAERQHWPTFAAAIDRLDYSIARRNWKGDEGEYRPLLFLLMSGEYASFGANMVGWQAVNIGLHGLVTWQLFGLLALTLNQKKSLLLAALFASLSANARLVQDPYVGGYLAGAAMFLAAIRTATVAQQDENGTWLPWLRYAALMTLAGFCFELFVVLSMVFAGSLLSDFIRRGVRLRNGLVALLIAPAVIYSAFYLPRLFLASRLFFVDGLPGSDMLSREHLLRCVLAFPATLIGVCRDVWLPTQTRTLSWASSAAVRLALLIGLTLVVACLLFAGRMSVSRSALQRLCTYFLLLAVYVAVIQLGRGGLDSSHLYVAGLTMVLGLAVLFESPVTRRVWVTTASLLVMMTVLNAALVLRTALSRGSAGAEVVRYLAALDRFVTTHRSVAGSSFSVDTPGVDPGLSIVAGYPDGSSPVWRGPLWQTFTGATTDAPSYRLVWNGKDLVVYRAD